MEVLLPVRHQPVPRRGDRHDRPLHEQHPQPGEQLLLHQLRRRRSAGSARGIGLPAPRRPLLLRAGRRLERPGPELAGALAGPPTSGRPCGRSATGPTSTCPTPPPPDWEREYYGANYQRLRAVKAHVRPGQRLQLRAERARPDRLTQVPTDVDKRGKPAQPWWTVVLDDGRTPSSAIETTTQGPGRPRTRSRDHRQRDSDEPFAGLFAGDEQAGKEPSNAGIVVGMDNTGPACRGPPRQIMTVRPAPAPGRTVLQLSVSDMAPVNRYRCVLSTESAGSWKTPPRQAIATICARSPVPSFRPIRAK